MKKLNTRRLNHLSKATQGACKSVKSDPSNVVLGSVLWTPTPSCFLTALGHVSGPFPASSVVRLLLFSKMDSLGERMGALPFTFSFEHFSRAVKSLFTLARLSTDQDIRHQLSYLRRSPALLTKNYKTHLDAFKISILAEVYFII